MVRKIILFTISALLLVGCTSKNDFVSELELSQNEIHRLKIEIEQLTKDNLEFKELRELQSEENDDIKALLDKQKKELIDQKVKYDIKITELEKLGSFVDREIQVLGYSEGYIYYVYVESDDSYQNITIIGEDSDSLLRSEDFKRIQFGENEGKSVTVSVIGSIYNVRFVYFEFNDDFSEKTISTTFNSEKVIRNSILEIESPIPEGIPFEMLIWEDESGKEHSYVIEYDGRDDYSYIFLD